MPVRMPGETMAPTNPKRPLHKRTQSSKSAILRAILGTDPSEPNGTSRSNATLSSSILGERNGNMQSTAPNPERHGDKGDSPRKRPLDDVAGQSSQSTPVDMRHDRFISEPSVPGEDKENKSPSEPLSQSTDTPIWAQFATMRDDSIAAEIARYTPSDYHPGTQRNFNGMINAPKLRPTLGRDSRPQSAHILSAEGLVEAIGRRVSGGRPSLEHRSSEDSSKRYVYNSRRASNGSSEQGAPKEKLNVVKRSGRVMAAVAAFQGKSRPVPVTRKESDMDPKAVDEAFEAVLEARNIPEPQRQRMRTLTIRVKADFVRQDQEASQAPKKTPLGTLNNPPAHHHAREDSKHMSREIIKDIVVDEEKSTRRSRPRSRTFTFSRGDKSRDRSVSKKQRATSKTGLASLVISKDTNKGMVYPSTPTTPTGSFGRRAAPPTYPADYIAYLQASQDPTKTEVGRMHKLRLLLRNETVAWVDSFLALGGMAEIIKLLERVLAIEWREDHEDQLLHETLLCLKGVCTTERAMVELDSFADTLFPMLMGKLFDEERKGPAEYTTRAVIINILFNFLSSATASMNPVALELHARRLLAYLGEPAKPEDARPVDFVLEMHVPRPYKLWCREISNVSKEVFWIFLHNLNVVPLPKKSSDTSDADSSHEERETATQRTTTFRDRHFPGSRPPVPAAPYIGGVEWDATTYIAAHIDLMNGLIASIQAQADRNALRSALRASGFEKVLGGTLRTCKEKFYSCVHDGLKVWVAAAHEDGWDTKYVRQGPCGEESPKKSPVKVRRDATPPPKLQAISNLSDVKLDLGDDGWLG